MLLHELVSANSSSCRSMPPVSGIRYHHLFGAFLRARLKSRGREHLPRRAEACRSRAALAGDVVGALRQASVRGRPRNGRDGRPQHDGSVDEPGRRRHVGGGGAVLVARTWRRAGRIGSGAGARVRPGADRLVRAGRRRAVVDQDRQAHPDPSAGADRVPTWDLVRTSPPPRPARGRPSSYAPRNGGSSTEVRRIGDCYPLLYAVRRGRTWTTATSPEPCRPRHRARSSARARRPRRGASARQCAHGWRSSTVSSSAPNSSARSARQRANELDLAPHEPGRDLRRLALAGVLAERSEDSCRGLVLERDEGRRRLRSTPCVSAPCRPPASCVRRRHRRRGGRGGPPHASASAVRRASPALQMTFALEAARQAASLPAVDGRCCCRCTGRLSAATVLRVRLALQDGDWPQPATCSTRLPAPTTVREQVEYGTLRASGQLAPTTSTPPVRHLAERPERWVSASASCARSSIKDRWWQSC